MSPLDIRHCFDETELIARFVAIGTELRRRFSRESPRARNSRQYLLYVEALFISRELEKRAERKTANPD